jgi:serine/threonine protein kinase/formylglycine-generating enzyme required for sulfatase activity
MTSHFWLFGGENRMPDARNESSTRESGSAPDPVGYAEENSELLRCGLLEGILDVEELALYAMMARDLGEKPIGSCLLAEGVWAERDLARVASRLSRKVLYCPSCRSFERRRFSGQAPPCSRCRRDLVFYESLEAGSTAAQAGREGEEAGAPPEKAAPALQPVPVFPAADRYLPEGEIGRGGIGRVLSARDTVLGREVAVKEMIRHVDNPEMLRRFLREGVVAGRLMHPHVVPILDMGVREEAEGKVPFITMGKVAGRDLQEILRAQHRGEEETKRSFSLGRLLSIFQDVCLAVAYAHAHGVIHRDLKPSNVMVGTFGEVYVIDWGLAKVKDREDAESDEVLARGVRDASPALTLEGDILGTPAYMSPEQAEGRVSEIDERSDVYALGGILYEILTFRPPHEGEDGETVLSKVLTGHLTPPSVRATQMKKNGDEVRDDGPGPFQRDVPEDLEAIVLQAMASDKVDRYATVMDLHDEVQNYLDGEKQKEHNRRSAREAVRQGRELALSMEEMRREVGEVEEKEKEARGKIEQHWPVEKKRDWWELVGRVRDLRREIVRSFGEASTAFQEALGFERGNRRARAGLADLYWNQYLREEEAGNEGQMIYFESLVRKYNDGQYDERLQGDGTLTVTAGAYTCACLSDGREVAPDEMEVLGFHPSSGRALDGRESAQGMPDLEPGEPVHLRVHGPECRPETLEGVDVWLFRFEEKDRLLVPVEPDSPDRPPAESDPPDSQTPDSPDSGMTPGIPPEEVLDALYDPGSPFRPAVGLHLGKTPVPQLKVPMGSYLLILHREGYVPVRGSVHIGRLARERLDATLFRTGELPPGFLQVSRGRFQFQGDRENPYSQPLEILDLDDFFMARFSVSAAEYLAFLNALARDNPDEAARRVPREAERSGAMWPRLEDGTYAIPTAAWRADANPELQENLGRLSRCDRDWEEAWPVSGVSWEDLMSYAAWRTREEGWLFTLSHDRYWEKAARGADGRPYPWGSEFDATFCNSNKSHEDGMYPVALDSFLSDESPYGVRGMSGNIRDFCLNDPGPAFPGWRLIRGGCWSHSGPNLLLTFRVGMAVTNLDFYLGGRLMCVARLPQQEREDEGTEYRNESE